MIGAGIVPRTLTTGTATTRDVNIETFGPGVDLAFYRKLSRNGFEAPARRIARDSQVISEHFVRDFMCRHGTRARFAITKFAYGRLNRAAGYRN